MNLDEPTSTSSASNSAPSPLAPTTDKASQDIASEFAQQAEESSPGIVREFIDFLIEYRLWWLTPVVVTLLLLAGLVFLSGTAVAPFIYPMW